MNKKEKAKKKMVKKETENGADKETSKEESQQEHAIDFGNGSEAGASEPRGLAREGVREKRRNSLVARKLPPEGKAEGRTTPDGFFVAHPRSMKRTTNFKDVHSRKLAELLEAFHMFDFDRDGVINAEDLKKTFASLNWGDVEEEQINQMLSEALNPLNFDAFVILLGYKTLDFDPEEVLLDALSNWDDHHGGLISHERLFQHIMVWGNKFTEEEAMAALADAPIVFTKTKEKMIDYVQFSEDLCGLRKLMQKKSSEGGH